MWLNSVTMNQLSKFISIFGLMLLALPSCKQHSSFKKNLSEQKQYFTDQVEQLIAKYPDIPFPLHVSFAKSPRVSVVERGRHEARSFRIDAVSVQSPVELNRAYEHEMERLGWQRLALFEDVSETVLLFNKPQRICVISLRQSRRVASNATAIVIHVGDKEA